MSAAGSSEAKPRARKVLWSALDQALHSVDLLMHAGGFSAIVLDMGSIPPEFAWRVPLATWFRMRAAADRTQSCMVLLTQHPCARTCAELVLRMSPGKLQSQGNVMTAMGYQAAVERQRRSETTGKVVSIRKPPQRASAAEWSSRAAWAAGGDR